MPICCRVMHLMAHQHLRPNRTVATGFMPGTLVYENVIAGSTRSLRNNHRSPNPVLVTWQLGSSHLRGIPTPTGPHSIASRSHKATKHKAHEARSTRPRDQPARYRSNWGARHPPCCLEFGYALDCMPALRLGRFCSVWFGSVRTISGAWVLNQMESKPCT